MKKISLLFTAVISASLFIAGCGKVQKNYTPLVPQDTFATISWNEERMANSSMVEFLIKEQNRYNEALVKVLKEKSNRPECLDRMLQSDLNDAYLKALKQSACKWCLLTVAKPDIADIGESQVITIPNTALVAYYKENKSLDSLCEQIQEVFDTHMKSFTNNTSFKQKFDEFYRENIKITDDNVAGCKVKVLTILDKKFDASIKGFEPCIGVLNKRLVIFASSKKAFQDTAALYNGQIQPVAADSQEAKNAIPTGNIISSANIYGVAEILHKIAEKSPIADENIEKYVSSLQTIGIGNSVNDEENTITVSLGMKFENEQLAQEIKTLVDGGMGLLNFMVAAYTMQNPSLSFVPEIIQGIKSSTKDRAFAVEVTISKSTFEKINYENLLRENEEILCRKRCKKSFDNEAEDEE